MRKLIFSLIVLISFYSQANATSLVGDCSVIIDWSSLRFDGVAVVWTEKNTEIEAHGNFSDIRNLSGWIDVNLFQENPVWGHVRSWTSDQDVGVDVSHNSEYSYIVDYWKDYTGPTKEWYDFGVAERYGRFVTEEEGSLTASVDYYWASDAENGIPQRIVDGEIRSEVLFYEFLNAEMTLGQEYPSYTLRDKFGKSLTLEYGSSFTSGGSGTISVSYDYEQGQRGYFDVRNFTGFGYKLNPVPEPATMLLLGSGLVGLAVIGRKKFKK